jgi:uncharacterized Fe-S cluster protein YjdI
MPDSTRPTATRKRYHGKAVEVSFDGARCRHAAECLRGLPAVFDLSRRPWILPDADDPDHVVSRRGALPNRCTPNPPDHLDGRDAKQADRGDRNGRRPGSATS